MSTKNVIQKNYFDVQSLSTSGGVVRFFDRAVGGMVSKFITNWLNAKNSLPKGRTLLLAKVGIDISHSDDTPVTAATLSAIRKGILKIEHNSRIIREYRLSEFINSPVANRDDLKAGTIFIAFDSPEQINAEVPLDVTVEYPVLPVGVDLCVNLKGLEEHVIG